MTLQIKAAVYRPQSPMEKIAGTSQLIPLQDRGGFVFLLAHANNENADTEMLFQVLSDHVHRLAESFGKEANAQHRFEQFLGALNETLAEQVREGRWRVPIEDFHAIVGIASGTQMYLSGAGELTSLFLHRKPSQRYQVFNLFRSIQTEKSLPTWEKPFAVVLDGDLHEGDVFCVTEKELQREIQPDELNSILSTLPPIGAVEKIRQYFSHKESLSLIVLKAHLNNSEDIQSFESTHRSKLSVSELVDTEDETEKLLEDQSPSFTSMGNKIVQRVMDKITSKDSAYSQHTHLSAATKRFSRTAVKVGSKYARTIAQTSIKKAKKLSTTEGRKETVRNVKALRGRTESIFQSLAESSNRVPRSTKYLAGGLILAVVVLSLGISTLSKSKAQSAEQEAFDEQIVQIEDIVERGAGAVIYKDEDQARSLFGNALTLVEDLQTNTPEREAQATELLKDIQSSLDEIRHLVTVPNPPLLGDLATVTDGVFGAALVQSNEVIYLFGTDGAVYQLDRSTKRLSVAAESEGSIAITAAAEEDGNMYALTQSNNVYSVNLDDATVISALQSSDTYVDVIAYANRIYLLRPSTDTVQGQILRAGLTGSTFGDPTEWITQRTTDLSKAVSLTIDGTIFVLSKDGEITRFASGSEVGWNPGVVDPPMTVASKIWTDSNSDYVYVLEPDTKRIVVFSKESGEFLVQYRSDAFTDLTDFIVDEDGYSIYLLAGSKLYSIAASHIE
ncbi:hypothetical protein HOI18_03195 [Candidatus Uhrbacteria bacterium]|mgnify:FL=1|jgi:hypothetical protein|nr:hypothetical protein [Candidatus Uhrbacteria bacterium]